MRNLNPNCDGSHCHFSDSEVRVYPLGSGGNLILCQTCFAHENRYRHIRSTEYGRPEEWPQVNWAYSEVYKCR